MTGVLTPNLDAIPDELRKLSRWVCWRMEDGKKVPYDANALNSRASSTNPATWAGFAEAEAAFIEREGHADAFSGIGLVLDGDGLVGVDIDHCVVDGVPGAAALKLLEQLGAAYVETSPSGTGLRAFGLAEPLERGCKGVHDGLNVELYSAGRYLTVTGRIIKAGGIEPLQGFAALAQRIRGDRVVIPETGEIVDCAPHERHAGIVKSILAGSIYHDSLRDLAASLVATGMNPGAAVNHLRAIMDASAAPRDDRWATRRAQIPELVSSASAKFDPVDVSALMRSPQASNEPRFKLLTGAELAGMPPLRWLVRGVLPATGLAALYGPSGSGKSFLALDLFAAVAEGRAWYGCRVTSAPVVYVALEGEAGLSVRVQAWEHFHGRALPDAMRIVIQAFKLTDAQDVADLATTIVGAGGNGAVVVLDTLNRAAPSADENSSKDMGMILDAAKVLQAKVGGLVVLVHHTGKDESRGMRGHSSLFAALDASIEIERKGERRAWKIAKAKDGQDGIAFDFKVQEVELGHDEYGDRVTSCVAVSAERSQDERKAPLTESQREGLHALYRAAAAQDEVDAQGNALVPLDVWRREFYRASTADSEDAKRMAFTRARKALVQLCMVTVQDDVYQIAASAPGLVAARASLRAQEKARLANEHEQEGSSFAFVRP